MAMLHVFGMDTHFLVSCLFVSEPPLQSPALVHVLLIFISVPFLLLSSPLPAQTSVTGAGQPKPSGALRPAH